MKQGYETRHDRSCAASLPTSGTYIPLVLDPFQFVTAHHDRPVFAVKSDIVGVAYREKHPLHCTNHARFDVLGCGTRPNSVAQLKACILHTPLLFCRF
jgi:hypothetical protein